SVLIALSGCDRTDNNRTTSIPRGVDAGSIVQQTPTGLSAPPAQPDRGAIPPNANAVAPGTNAEQALANQPASGTSGQSEVAVSAAQEAAARAPDTASADAAKKDASNVLASTRDGSPTARDTAANNPRHGTLTKDQEVNESPKAGQVNNHSSPALEKDSGR
ncbi:MAG TPA: hypothetical protein VM100_14025, partial [Longimicrobiales bacterium]|nr:hypothetical protein [Longimicrobiales bacterium]